MKTLRQKSPFTSFFDILIKSRYQEMSVHLTMSTEVVKSRLYFPKLFEYIQSKLHIIPLWTGIMTPKIQQQFPSVKIISDNNIVEAKIYHLKVIDMRNKLKSTSQFVALKEERLLSKNVELFKQCYSSNPIKKGYQDKERWWRRNQNKYQRIKEGYYVKNFDNFGKFFSFDNVMLNELVAKEQDFQQKKRKR